MKTIKLDNNNNNNYASKININTEARNLKT